MTLWFHLLCGAYTRPEPFLDAASAATETLPEREMLDAAAALGLEHPRLTRLRGVERAKTGRSACRSCRKAIPKDTWRLALTFYDDVEGRFSPGGFLHLGCAGAYFGTRDLLDRVRHFTPGLAQEDAEEIGRAFAEARLDAPGEDGARGQP